MPYYQQRTLHLLLLTAGDYESYYYSFTDDDDVLVKPSVLLFLYRLECADVSLTEVDRLCDA